MSKNLIENLQPLFFRTYKSDEKNEFQKLLKKSEIQIFNSIEGQLKELIKSLNPKEKILDERIRKLIHQHINGIPIEDYGVWVYYPWSNRVVHILDEDEFIFMRTDRNKYKITEEEQSLLKNKQVGVIGLSAGKAAVLSLIMERICGSIKIADFDILELSNLNRILSGIHNLDVKKSILVAREILEIDPFIKVTLFNEGVTENNIKDFFELDGKIDLLIECCDSLDIKIEARNYAKKYKIPVVMHTSDRGLIDVERFDLEPERRVLHGLVPELNIKELQGLTNEEKIPLVLSILNADEMSTSMKASLVEIEESITTWPQLASDVIGGGSMAAVIARKIFLNEFNDSGRYYFDIDEVIKNNYLDNKKIEPDFKKSKEDIFNNRIIVELKEAIKKLSVEDHPNQIDVNKEKLETILNSAITAPSGGNSQPWFWYYASRTLFLYLNTRRMFLNDYNYWGTIIGLGTACQNLIIEADKQGLEVRIEKFPLKGKTKLSAVIRFFEKTKIKNDTEINLYNNLYHMIHKRGTNRRKIKRIEIASENIEKIKSIKNYFPGFQLKIIDDTKSISRVGELLGNTERLYLMSPANHEAFNKEICWSHEEAESRRWGVDMESIDLTPAERAGYQIVKDWKVVQKLTDWVTGHKLKTLTKKSVELSSAIFLVTVPDQNHAENFFDAGRFLELIWLSANSLGIGIHPFCIPVYTYILISKSENHDYSKKQLSELKNMREDFYKIWKINDNEIPVFCGKLSAGNSIPMKKSFRLPLEEVFLYE